jgi:cysteine desulfurase
VDVIYLDHAATTPCDPRVVEAMLPYFGETFANASSRLHRPGQAAATALEEQRARVAEGLGAQSATEIVFTSGATESNNLALKGTAASGPATRRHIVTQVTEHASVLEPLAQLERRGFEITRVRVTPSGLVDLDALREAVRDDTMLVSVMLANNETGVIQPIREIAGLAHQRGALVHCDAAQAVGKIPVSVTDLDVDLLSLAAHKIHGPKGIGALYIRRRSPVQRLEPLLAGGGHEHGHRSGTPNLPGAVGLATALDLAIERLDVDAARIGALRDRFEASILAERPDTVIHGVDAPRLPGFSNLHFPGVDGSALLMSLPDLALSSGSACTSGHPEPSRVLRAMGETRRVAARAIRVSIGRGTTAGQTDRAAVRILTEGNRLQR